MAEEKEWTETHPKDAKIIALATILSKLEENQTSAVVTVQG